MDELHHIVNDVIVRFAGDGGEGVITTGEFFGLALARSGLDIFKVTSLPAEIKGGPAMIQVRVGEEPPKSQGSFLDILVCFNNEVYHLNKADLKPNGVLIYDPDCEIDETNADATKIEIPLTEIAKKEAGGALSKNMVALGAIGGLLDIEAELFEPLVHARWGKKGEKVIGNNLAALRLGRDFAQNLKHLVPFRIQRHPHKGAQVIQLGGNDAIALGSIASGLSVFAGYPITPASTILEKLAVMLPSFGGKVMQVEDEIAALGCVLGASYAGYKAATSTSGPGVSLMVEEIGLASMAEIPCVIFDAQRGGPSTGLPTKEEQSDLNLAIYGGHGDSPRIVLAPANVRDCFDLTIEAFNLSEMCQMPTLFLTDFYLAQAAATTPEPDLSSYEIINRLRPTAEDLKDYKRFKLTESGVSPMAKPYDDATFYIATGLEHNEIGNPDISPAAHRKMSDKRHQKLQTAIDYAEKKGTFARQYGDPEADIAVITWGSTEGAMQEAIDLAARQDLSVAQLHLLLLNPLPDQTIFEFIKNRKRIIVAELNYTGQLAQRLRAALNIQVESFTKCTGQPFTPYELLKQIMYYFDWDTGRSEPVLSQVARVQKQRQAMVPTPGHDGQGIEISGAVTRV
ncbi:MAG: 2-oxoacid:acceptor oxidoreductase subunit alpha [Abitibacteriaceae bacterium]|nr:2-oxoacid:acceptor oxidoreductase subunit alpha [Abditibacteriaceae bacterium]